MPNAAPISLSIGSKRQFRDHPWLWSILFIALAGPFNIAGWALGWPQGESHSLAEFKLPFFMILMPCTVIALVMQDRMWRKQAFDGLQLLLWAAIGLGIAALTGPLFFAVGAVVSAQIAPDNFGDVLMAGYVFGFMFGIINASAIVLGLPCALCAILAAYLCSAPLSPGATAAER